MLEAESEWAQHKKVIKVPPKVGPGRAIPTGFPYVCVEFGLDGGFAHVIEDEEKFSRTFARVIVRFLVTSTNFFLGSDCWNVATSSRRVSSTKR